MIKRLIFIMAMWVPFCGLAEEWRFVLVTTPASPEIAPESFVIATTSAQQAATFRSTLGKQVTLPVRIKPTGDGFNRNYHQAGAPLWSWSFELSPSFPGGGSGIIKGITRLSDLEANPAGYITSNGSDANVLGVRVFSELLGSAGSMLSNVSTRGLAGSNDRTLVVGFIISGNLPRNVLIRSLGPTLTAFGVNQVLADPVLQAFSGSALIAENDDWDSLPAYAKAVAGVLHPSAKSEPMLILTLPPGAYTAHATGKNGVEGVVTIEVFDLDQ